VTDNHLVKMIENRLEVVERRLNRPDIPAGAEARIEEDLRDIYQRYARLTDKNAFEDHIVRVLSERTDEGTQMCTCSDQLCPIREGKVPPTPNHAVMTGGSDFREQLKRWKRSHPGNPVALEAAMDSWSDEFADLLVDIGKVKGDLARVLRKEAAPDAPDTAKTRGPTATPEAGVGADESDLADASTLPSDGGLEIEEVLTQSYQIPIRRDGEVVEVELNSEHLNRMAPDPLGIIKVVGDLKSVDTADEGVEVLDEYDVDPSILPLAPGGTDASGDETGEAVATDGGEAGE